MKQDLITKYKWPLIAVVAVLIVLGSIAGIYNNFVVLRANIDGQWSQVENQYQRQADLIPNLVATVSSAVTVETRFVTAVTSARSQWQTAQSGDILSKDTAGVNLQDSINAFIKAVATTENYPVLQANKQYTQLIDELTGTQNRIAVERGRYITAVQNYNIAIRLVPGAWFAGIFGFTPVDYYQAEPTALETPSVGGATQLP